MSTMSVSHGEVRSKLNPNAPLFIPAAFQRVEDFSPEWWNLVKTSTWFRDHWFSQHKDQDTFDGEDDVMNLLPDTFDLDSVDELSILEAELEETIQEMEAAEESSASASQEKEKPAGSAMEAAAIMKSLSLISPKSSTAKPVFDLGKNREKPVQCMSPKCSPRRIIQQPR